MINFFDCPNDLAKWVTSHKHGACVVKPGWDLFDLCITLSRDMSRNDYYKAAEIHDAVFAFLKQHENVKEEYRSGRLSYYDVVDRATKTPQK